MQFLHTIRSKSKPVRAQYAFLSALFVTFAIGAVWATTIPARFSGIDAKEGVANIEKEREDTKSFTELFNETKTQLGNVMNSLEESPETSNLDTLSHDMEKSDVGGGESLMHEDTTGTSSPIVPTLSPVEREQRETPKEATSSPRKILIGTTTTGF